ncbi:hypothetical protein VNO80_10847 [Phaseolus coccineus]|uniref:Uncharacterized protein n=1 Tax=Phaseolus coccineus TaxID=3886 RepID=A0AAN9N9C1_PHACN
MFWIWFHHLHLVVWVMQPFKFMHLDFTIRVFTSRFGGKRIIFESALTSLLHYGRWINTFIIVIGKE